MKKAGSFDRIGFFIEAICLENSLSNSLSRRWVTHSIEM